MTTGMLLLNVAHLAADASEKFSFLTDVPLTNRTNTFPLQMYTKCVTIMYIYDTITEYLQIFRTLEL
jgi:hypothetical protein